MLLRIMLVLVLLSGIVGGAAVIRVKTYEGDCPLVVCGEIALSADSATAVQVSDSWSPKTGKGVGQIQTLTPGQQSSFRDTDGFNIPEGCVGDLKMFGGISLPFGSGWYKINDFQQGTLVVTC